MAVFGSEGIFRINVFLTTIAIVCLADIHEPGRSATGGIGRGGGGFRAVEACDIVLIAFLASLVVAMIISFCISDLEIMREDPELVRDAGAAFKTTQFLPNDEDKVEVTTHRILEGLRRYSEQKWIRGARIGKGGQGSVFLETLQEDGLREEERSKRAVKKIDISDEEIKRKYYIRELETLFKFSQEGVRLSDTQQTNKQKLTQATVQKLVRQSVRLV